MSDVVTEEKQPTPPPPPRTIDELPPEVRDRLKARMQASEEYTEDCERRAGWRHLRGVLVGAVTALVMAPLIGGESWWFALIMTSVGTALAFVVVRRECEALGGGAIYGGGCVLFTLIATFSGLTHPSDALSTTIGIRDSCFFAWAILCGMGALVAYMAEQDRSLNVG